MLLLHVGRSKTFKAINDRYYGVAKAEGPADISMISTNHVGRA